MRSAACRRRPDLPRALRRGDRPDAHLRHGRAAPRSHRRPHAARVQGRRERRSAAGGLPRDDHHAGARRGPLRPPDRWSRPVRRLSCSRSSRWSGAAASSSRTRSSVARSRASTSARSSRASERRCRRWRLAGYPVVDVKVDAGRRLVPRRRLVRNGVQDRWLDWRSRRRLAEAGPVHARADHEGRSHDAGGLLRRRHGRPELAARADPGHGAMRASTQIVSAHGAAGGDVRLRHRPALG